MPVSFNSPARNLFLLGSTGDIVGNFFKTIDQSSTTDSRHIPAEIRYNESDEKYLLAGQARDVDDKDFGFFEKRDLDGIAEWDVKVESTQVGVNTTLRAMELDSNGNLIVAGKTGSIPWVAKYSNGGVIDWQSTTNTADVEYTGLAIDSNDNIYACGSTPFNGGLIGQAFVEKFDSSGTPGWGKSAFMVGRDAVLLKCSVNTRGEVVAVGYLEDDSAWKGYIVKIDTTTGNVLWDRTLSSYELTSIGDYVSLICEDVYIDNQDQIYIVGRTNNPWPPRSTRGFIVKYSAEGNIIWQKETEDNIEFYNVRSDGDTEQTIVMGGQTQDGTALSNVVLSSYAKNGDLIWRRKIVHDNRTMDSTPRAYGLDFDLSFYYIFFKETSFVLEDTYTYARVSISGNGAGNFDYNSGATNNISYDILNVQDKIGRLSDGSVRQDTSDLITYPFNANKLLFDDLATQVSNKKRQMDTADSFEYSGSPAIRPADFQELNLLGDVGIDQGDPGTPYSDGWQAGILNPTNSFDGSTATGSGSNGGSFGPFTYTFPNQQTGVTSARLFVGFGASSSQVGGTTNTFLVNGIDVTQKAKDAGLYGDGVTSGWIDVTSEVNGTWNTFTIRGLSGSTNPFVAAMEVDGFILSGNSGVILPTWLDQSGKGNDGVVNGATHNAAGYWEFDGVDDRILIDDDGRFHFAENGSDFGIEAWVRRTGDNNAYTTIAASWGQSTPVDNWILSHNLGILGFVWAPYSTGNYFLTGGSLTLNNWHHVIATRSGSNFKLYVDGIETASGTSSGSASSTLSYVEIGHYGSTSSGGGADSWFDGDIGEVRIYPRALTPAQVFQNYNATKSKYINEAPDTAPKIGPGIVYDSNLLLNYDFGNRATYDRVENLFKNNSFANRVDYNSTANGNFAFSSGPTNSTVGSNVLSPGGDLTGGTIVYDGTDASGGGIAWSYKDTAASADQNQIQFTDGDVVTYSVYAKIGSSNNVIKGIYLRTYSPETAHSFYLDSGTKAGGFTENSAGAAISSDILDVGNGWYRCSITLNITANDEIGFQLYLTNAGGATGFNDASGAGDTIHAWGAQVERNSSAGRYIKTSGSAITAPTTVKNLSSSSYPGTINGATFNSSGYFDFDDDYIDAGYSIPTNNFTVETWFKKTDTVYWSPVWACEVWNQSSGYLFYFEGNNVLELTTGGNLTGLLQVNTTGNMTDWRHLVLTMDGSNVTTIYQNGVLLGSTIITPVDMDAPVGSIQKPLRLGARFGNDGNGSADGRQTQSGGLRAYNRALSSTEVLQNFNATRSKYGV